MTVFPLFFTAAWWLAVAAAQRFDCTSQPCVLRPSFRIKAVVHGTKSDPTWKEIQAAMVQTAKDLKIDLDLKLYDVYDPLVMAAEIEQTAIGKPDALIVSIPDAIVQQAVGGIISSTTIPVFGLNSGYDVAQTLGLLGFVSMNDNLAGGTAGDYFASKVNATSADRGLFVNADFGSLAMEARKLGLEQALPNVEFDEAQFFADASEDERVTELNSMLVDCPYQFILVNGPQALPATLGAMKQNGCDFESTIIGAFSTDATIYQAIEAGELGFTISEQLHLQGALPVVMATLYVTTGKRLAAPGESSDGIYLAGPVVIDRDDMPSNALQSCEAVGFPVCGQDSIGRKFGSCDCVERQKIRIAGVTHGKTNSGFWDSPYAAMEQAALDFGVEIETIRLEPESDEIMHGKMAVHIVDFCEQGVDGLFASIPSDVVREALAKCKEMGIPLVSINSGATASEELGLLDHIGQLEYTAGHASGERLIEAGATRGFCLMQEENNVGLMERCAGMEDAFAENDSVTFIGTMFADEELTVDEWVAGVENLVSEAGDWTGIAVLVGGQSLVPFSLELKNVHKDLLIGSFDISDDLYAAFDEGTVLFGIDQNSYLQGYLPVPFLAWYAYTKQNLANKFIESGPDFVLQKPTPAALQCEAILYEACPNATLTGKVEDNTTQTNTGGLSTGAIAGIAVAGVVLLLAASFVLYRCCCSSTSKRSSNPEEAVP